MCHSKRKKVGSQFVHGLLWRTGLDPRRRQLECPSLACVCAQSPPTLYQLRVSAVAIREAMQVIGSKSPMKSRPKLLPHRFSSSSRNRWSFLLGPGRPQLTTPTKSHDVLRRRLASSSCRGFSASISESYIKVNSIPKSHIHECDPRLCCAFHESTRKKASRVHVCSGSRVAGPTSSGVPWGCADVDNVNHALTWSQRHAVGSKSPTISRSKVLGPVDFSRLSQNPWALPIGRD